MSASALDGAPVASGKLRVFTQCEHTVVLVVACHHRKAWTVYTPFPHSHSLFHSVPGQRRGPVHALPLPSGMTDCLAPMVDVMLLMGLKTSTENLKLKAQDCLFSGSIW